MALLKIARMGHPVLLQEARPVERPDSDAIRALVLDMVETLEDAGGVGLAAPQVHRSLRLILARPMASGGPRDIPPMVLINPVLRPLDGGEELGFEGCLSMPGLRGIVPRAARVAYSALDMDGAPVEGVAEGYFARILQHEVDHLDGILFTARLRDWRHLAFDSEMAHLTDLIADAGRAPAAAKAREGQGS